MIGDSGCRQINQEPERPTRAIGVAGAMAINVGRESITVRRRVGESEVFIVVTKRLTTVERRDPAVIMPLTK